MPAVSLGCSSCLQQMHFSSLSGNIYLHIARHQLLSRSLPWPQQLGVAVWALVGFTHQKCLQFCFQQEMLITSWPFGTDDVMGVCSEPYLPGSLCVCVCIWVHVDLCPYGGQRPTLGSSLNSCSALQRQNLFLNPAGPPANPKAPR